MIWKPKYKRIYDTAFEMKVRYEANPTRECMVTLASEYGVAERTVRRYLNVAGLNIRRFRDSRGKMAKHP